MVKKKSKKDEKVAEIYFFGGPRDGTKMRVVNPPPPRLRLAFPDWCNYYRIKETMDYEYDMDREWISPNALGVGGSG